MPKFEPDIQFCEVFSQEFGVSLYRVAKLMRRIAVYRQAAFELENSPPMCPDHEERRQRVEAEAMAIWQERKTHSLRDAVEVWLEDHSARRSSSPEAIMEAERANEAMADELLRAGFSLEEIDELKHC